MKEIIELVSQFTLLQIITFIVLACLIVRGTYDFVMFVRNWILNWHNNKNAEEDKEEKIEERITVLEEHDDWKYNKILNLEQGQEVINHKLDDLKETNKQEVIAQYRSTIYRLYKEFKAKGYVTEMEYEMFRSLADIYLDYGGNGYYRNHVIPEIEALEIRK